MGKLIIENDKPLLIPVQLASAIGLNNAVLLQQLHFWMTLTQREVENKKWIYNTVDEWQLQFPFWSTRTIQRIIQNLLAMGLIKVQKLSKNKSNRTNYYTIDYNKLGEIVNEQSKLPICKLQSGVIIKTKSDDECDIMSSSTMTTLCPDGYTETKSEITTEKLRFPNLKSKTWIELGLTELPKKWIEDIRVKYPQVTVELAQSKYSALQDYYINIKPDHKKLNWYLTFENWVAKEFMKKDSLVIEQINVDRKTYRKPIFIDEGEWTKPYLLNLKKIQKKYPEVTASLVEKIASGANANIGVVLMNFEKYYSTPAPILNS